MSYQVLARKWRPRIFREMVGQEHVLQALINALDHNRLHHAYLFTGTRGVGKTTIARILAKCLNCEVGVSSEPCGTCSACTEINEGRFVDLIEVDAASRTKVEDTRELLENVQYAPTRGRYKVYLIDEVHMLSNSSFNALLKTLEEPPPHVKFLLATTDPQKLPVTVLSRCLQFNLKNMPVDRIVGHLSHVLEKEMVLFEESGLWQLAEAADGSMRDALSLTDQAIGFCGDKVTDEGVRDMLGTIDRNIVFDLLDALVQQDGTAMLAGVERLSEHAPDYPAALADMLSVLHRITIAQAVPDALDNSHGDRERVVKLAGMMPAEDVQLYYQIALLGRKDLPLCPDPRAGFEMVLLRMLAFRPQGVAPTAGAGALGAGAGVVGAAAGVPPAKKPESAASAAAPAGAHSAAALIKAQLSSEVNPPAAAPSPVQPPAPVIQTPVTQTEVTQTNTPVPAQVSASVESSQANSAVQSSRGAAMLEQAAQANTQLDQASAQTVVEVQGVVGGQGATAQNAAPQEPNKETAISLESLNAETWLDLYDLLPMGGMLGNTASHCVLQNRNGVALSFVLDNRESTLYDTSHQTRLAEMLSEYFNQPVQVNIEVGPVQGETPAARISRRKSERLVEAIASLKNDAHVQQLLEQFDGELIESSIRPVE